MNLKDCFGDIDIYLFDLLLKGTITADMKILDAGCGEGRNLIYFLKNGFDVSAVDRSSEAINKVVKLAGRLAPALPGDNFRVESVEKMSFESLTFDVVISSAVLHFARDEEQWKCIVDEMWRVLKPGGLMVARLTSSIGIEDRLEQISERHYRLPDGTDRFLVDEKILLHATASLEGASWIEPLKTVVVQNMRSMSNWCLRKA